MAFRKLTILSLAIVILSLVFSGLTLKPALAATEFKGIINADTTWTKANSPYSLTGNVLVNQGVVLTIEAGTTINLNSYYIMVNGTLTAKGISENQIVFQGGNSYSGKIIFTESSSGWNGQTGLGSIVDKVFLNHTDIEISGSPRISDSLLHYCGTEISAGSSAILNNRYYASRMIITSGSPTISGNDILGGVSNGFEMQYFTPIIINGGSPVILSNNIQLGETGIEINSGDAYVYSNNITGCQPDIRANSGVLEKNFCEGIIEVGNVTVRNNTVTSIEVQGTSTPSIIFNNIVAIRLSSSTAVDASYNWWGTANTSAIDQVIWDYNDDFSLGKVTYTPFLTAANTQAMPDPNPPQNLASTPVQLVSDSPLLGLDGLDVVIVVLLLVVVVPLILAVCYYLRRISDGSTHA